MRIELTVSRRARLLVEDGDQVEVGQQLTAGTPDPQDVLRVLGVRKVQEHLVDEVQSVYRTQGAPIHDKHIEIIIRQMLRRVTVIESGDSDLLAGDLVDRLSYEAAEPRGRAEGGTPASGRPVLMGITKASLATESWLSAASFQETTKVLTDAAIHGKSDSLRGSEGERHPRQADPGRHRSGAVPQHPGRADRGGQGGRRTRWSATTRSTTTSAGSGGRCRWRSSTSATCADFRLHRTGGPFGAARSASGADVAAQESPGPADLRSGEN